MSERRVMIITNDLVQTYNEDYLKKHSRAKKAPIERCFFPTLNTVLSAPSRMTIANYKKKYGEFAKWLIEYYNWENLMLDNVTIRVHFIFKDKTKRDCDNFSSFLLKVFQDAMVEKKTIIADDHFHLKSIFADAEYIKGEEKIEIVIQGG